MTRKTKYLMTLLLFKIAKFSFMIYSIILFIVSDLNSNIYLFLLGLMCIYLSMCFYGFEIRYKKMFKIDLTQRMRDFLYKGRTRKSRRLLIRTIKKNL